MKTRRIVVKNYKFESILGKAVFHNVPVWVPSESDITAKAFDQDRHDYSLSGDVIQLLERQIAVSFYTQFDSERALTADEVYGIMCVFEIKQTDLAKLLGVAKGTISKIIKGTMKMKRPETFLCMEMLKNEIMRPGYVRARLNHKQESLPESHLEPTYDFRKLTNRAA